MAAGEQGGDRMLADEPGAAEDEDAHRRLLSDSNFCLDRNI
jgi:hypothetical protein